MQPTGGNRDGGLPRGLERSALVAEVREGVRRRSALVPAAAFAAEVAEGVGVLDGDSVIPGHRGPLTSGLRDGRGERADHEDTGEDVEALLHGDSLWRRAVQYDPTSPASAEPVGAG